MRHRSCSRQRVPRRGHNHHNSCSRRSPSSRPCAGQVAWDTATTLLAKIFGVANRFRGARTLGDALNLNLGELASTLELTAALYEIPIPDLTDGPTLVDEVLSALIRLRESLPPVEHLILEQRLYASEPLTLEEIGRTTDLSRERIRQLQKRLESAVESAVGRRMEIIAALVRQQLAPVISASELEERVLSTYSGTTGPNGAEPPTELARHMLRAELDYSCIGGICLSKEAAAVLEELQSAAHDLADDVGLVEGVRPAGSAPRRWLAPTLGSSPSTVRAAPFQRTPRAA